MTAQEIIEKIRAEVERQREEIRPTDTGEMKVVGTLTQLEQGWLNALSWMEKVLDTFKEQPVCEGLVEEIARMWAKTCHLNEKKDKRIATLTSIEFEELARHFYELGRQSKPKVSEDVEEAAENYAYGESNDKYQGFVDGASWHKEQMMREAVDATVIAMKSGDKYCQAYITDRNSLANMCNGDHVKLIIVKEVK